MADNNKIIMLGGRRSGKSTILATLIHQLNNNSSHLCAFNDATPYGASTGMSVSLNDKRREIENYLLTRTKFGSNSQFIVDMSPSMEQGDFNIIASVQGASRIGFDFVDVPGEWMSETSPNHEKLRTLVSESDVFLIAIDTPYLMQDENPLINSVWNRVDEITNVINTQIKLEDPLDRKLIIFIPVKCEKWVNEGREAEITQRVKQAYRNLINTWVDNPAVEMWVMPIVTAGGIEHKQLLDAYRFYRSEHDKTGELCSIDPYSKIMYLRDGKTLFKSAVNAVDPEPDKELLISYTQIPLSWYKCNSTGFQPRLCEQVAYHVLRFMVSKEEELAQLKYNQYQNKHWLLRWFDFAGRRFGQYLPAYKELVAKIPIKTGGNGFEKLTCHV